MRDPGQVLKMRAAVTGWALRTPLGDESSVVLGRMLAGERALRPGTRGLVLSTIAGEPARSRHARFLRRMGLFAVEVGREALAVSGAVGGERLGVFGAVGALRANWAELLPALSRQAPDGARAWERGLSRLHPFWMLQYLSNNAHALLAADVQGLGEGSCFSGVCAGAQAIAAAARALAAGTIDAALVVAHDSLCEPETLIELEASVRLSHATLERLRAPYAPDAAGVVPGEAAVALVLERESAARSRARALVLANDGADGSAHEPGAEIYRHVVAALAPGVELVDGAARALPGLDRQERALLSELLPGDTPLCASSAALGDAGAARPLLQVIVLAECLRRGMAPPIAGLREPADGPLRPLRAAEPTSARVALAITTGAPGQVGAVRVERAPR